MNARKLHAVAADYVFDGTTRHAHAAVMLDGSQIAQIVPGSEILGVFPSRSCLMAFGSLPVSSTFRSMAAEMCCSTICPQLKPFATIAVAHRKFGTTGFFQP